MMKNLRRPVFFPKLPISVTEVLKGAGVAGFLAGFFYRSVFAFIPMLLPAMLFVWMDRKKEARGRNKRLRQQFGECILSVGGAVKAGYAAENAFVESIRDMEMMYGANAEIVEELVLVKGGLNNHLTLERLLQEMGQRTDLRDIQEFAEIFAITKRNGGSLSDIIQMTAHNIRTSVALEEEVQTLLASRRLEQKVMNLTPFLLVLYLQITTPGYFDMFFQDITGRVMMTGFLVWYMAAYWLSEHIMRNAV